jgi:hypothetical protein
MVVPSTWELVRRYTGKKTGSEVVSYYNPADKKYYIFFNGQTPWKYDTYSLAFLWHYYCAYELIWRFEGEKTPEIGKILAYNRYEDLNLDITTIFRGEPLQLYATMIKTIDPGLVLGDQVHPSLNHRTGISRFACIDQEALELHEDSCLALSFAAKYGLTLFCGYKI